MSRLFFKILFLSLALTCVGLVNGQTEDSTIPSGWKKVNACRIGFLIPTELKNQYVKGFDSCFAEFRNRKIRLAIDYGWNGGPFEKTESNLDFTEEFIEIDSKRVQIITYRDSRKDSNAKFVAGLYVVLFESPNKEGSMSEFLYMTLETNEEADLKLARTIFLSIHFDAYSPRLIIQQPSRQMSWERNAGDVFLNLTDGTEAAANLRALVNSTDHR